MAPHNPIGTKRTCPQCSAHFYDLNRSPAHCPKCDHEHDPAAQFRSRRTKRAAPEKAPKPALVKPRTPVNDEDEAFGMEGGGQGEMEELEGADDIEVLGEIEEIEEKGDDELGLEDGDVGDAVLIDDVEEDEEEEEPEEDEDETTSKSKRRPSTPPSKKKRK